MQFYLKNVERGYKVPEEIREFVNSDSEEQREAAIRAKVDAEMKILEDEMSDQLDSLRGR